MLTSSCFPSNFLLAKMLLLINIEILSTIKGNSSEWHYYISSRSLTAEQLLHHVRMEWSVESMHWLLDVHFEEDFCLIESKAVQQHLNMFRKSAINLIKLFKSRTETKRPISNIMLDCLINPADLLRVIGQNWFAWHKTDYSWQAVGFVL